MPKIESWELKAKIFEKKIIAMEKEIAKNFSPKKVADIKAELKANRKSAYDKEDKLHDSVPAAIKKGITGKKYKDFLPDKDFKNALSEWEGALAKQQELVSSLEDLSKDAKKRHPDFKRARDEFLKDMKKEGQSEKNNKALRKTFDKAALVLSELDFSKDAFGTLQAKDAFFGANLKKSRDVVIDKALKEGKGDELPDMLLENPKRQQTDNTAKRLGRNIEKYTAQAKILCDRTKFETIPTDIPAKKQLEKDVQTAKAFLKKSSEHLKKLQILNKDLQAAKKKQAKLIAAHNEKGKMNSLIKTVADLSKASEDTYNNTEDLVDDADSAL